MTDDDRVILTFEQAEAMLPKGNLIHTFRQTGSILVGADWDRKDILDALRKFSPELSGPQATSMGHGIVLEDDHGWVFIATIAMSKSGVP